SNGTGVGVTVGGVPPRRNLPTATVGQPFRLYQRAALKPPEVSRTPHGGPYMRPVAMLSFVGENDGIAAGFGSHAQAEGADVRHWRFS
ncbi:MAG: hypothetical protein V3W34_05580, partial [Phycisphaerae bacterium]